MAQKRPSELQRRLAKDADMLLQVRGKDAIDFGRRICRRGT